MSEVFLWAYFAIPATCLVATPMFSVVALLPDRDSSKRDVLLLVTFSIVIAVSLEFLLLPYLDTPVVVVALMFSLCVYPTFGVMAGLHSIQHRKWRIPALFGILYPAFVLLPVIGLGRGMKI